MRFVYNLQEANTSDDSDESESDSDDSLDSRRVNASSRKIRSGKQRMSIMTNQLLSVPRPEENGNGWYDSGCGWHISEPQAPPKSASTRRKFFQSGARWDDRLQRVLVSYDGLAMPQVSVAEMMENGGQVDEPDVSDIEEEMEVDGEEGES